MMPETLRRGKLIQDAENKRDQGLLCQSINETQIERDILQKNQNPPEHLVYIGRNTQSNKDMSTTLVVYQSNLLRDGLTSCIVTASSLLVLGIFRAN